MSNQHHVDVATLIRVIHATPMANAHSKTHVIERLRRETQLHQLKSKTVNSFVLGYVMGTFRGDPHLDQTDLELIINEVRDLSKLPLVQAEKT